jgi:hypothetical protein
VSDRIDLTWPDGNGHPFRIVNPELVTYHADVLDAAGKVIGREPWSFTIATVRPASAAEVDVWWWQP